MFDNINIIRTPKAPSGILWPRETYYNNKHIEVSVLFKRRGGTSERLEAAKSVEDSKVLKRDIKSQKIESHQIEYLSAGHVSTWHERIERSKVLYSALRPVSWRDNGREGVTEYSNNNNIMHVPQHVVQIKYKLPKKYLTNSYGSGALLSIHESKYFAW